MTSSTRAISGIRLEEFDRDGLDVEVVVHAVVGPLGIGNVDELSGTEARSQERQRAVPGRRPRVGEEGIARALHLRRRLERVVRYLPLDLPAELSLGGGVNPPQARVL